ncbi:MAG: hypothetical protein L3J16_06555, partial [Anaerolineales bacterium]|nr:hypothetical protein [Anaerolineales bacterium]
SGCGKAYFVLACAFITFWTFHHPDIISQIPINLGTPWMRAGLVCCNLRKDFLPALTAASIITA